MLRTTIRGLLAHKVRLVSTMLAVILGVGFMAGTLVLTDTIKKTLDNVFGDVYANTDAVVRAEVAFEGPAAMGDPRGRIDASLLDVVRGVDGVAEVQGQTEGYAQLVGTDGELLGNPEMGAPTSGGNWPESGRLNPFSLVEGRAPERDDEVVIDRKSAKDGDLAVGDTTTVVVQGSPQQVTVVGIAKFGSADSAGGASSTLFTLPAAQRLVGEPGKFDAIWVGAEPGVTQTELAGRIAAVLPAGIQAVTGAQATADEQDAVQEGLNFFNIFLLTFAVVALLVGSFMIFNTFSITVAQRTRANSLLRAIGASRRQLLISVLAEAVVVGAIASLIGVAVGVAVAYGLKALLAAFGLDLPSGGVVFGARTVVVSMVVGVTVTVVAALSPARRAAKVAPVAAMREVATGSSGYGSKQRTVVGVSVLGLGVVLLLVGLVGKGANALALVGGGALLVFFGVSILGRTIAVPLSRVIGAPLPRVRGIAGRLAHENAMRNPKRTAATASALMIGVALVGFITILAASTRVSINSTIDGTFTGDLVVDSSTGQTGGLDPGLASPLSERPEVAGAAGVRAGLAEIDGAAMFISAVDPTAASRVINLEPVQGALADLERPGTIAVQEDEAEDKSLHVGDTIPAVFGATGASDLTVAMIFSERQVFGPYLVGFSTYEPNFASDYDVQVYVTKAPGASQEQLVAAVDRVAEEYPGAEVLDRSGFKAEQSRQLDQLLGLVYALLALAIVIALLGIGNTLALSILERTRELGVLRALGMTRPQLRTSVRWESVVIALQGTFLGLVIGTFFGWAMVRALMARPPLGNDQGLTELAIPVETLAVVVVLATVAGVLAAVAPARRAARLDILRAIVTE